MAGLSAAIGRGHDVAPARHPEGAAPEKPALEEAKKTESDELRKLRVEATALRTALEQARSDSLVSKNVILENRRKGDGYFSRAQNAERRSEIYRAEAAFWEQANRRSEMRAKSLGERLERGEGGCHCQEILIFEGICRVVESFWLTITNR